MNAPAEEAKRQVTASVASRRMLVTVLVALVLGACALLLSVEQLTFLVSDDAYYYLNVARNIVHGAGSSFDAINPTNGYHPLWMLCLLPVYGLFGASTELALRVALLVQGLFVTITVWLSWDLIERYARGRALPVIAAITVAGILWSPLQIMFNGLETDLVILMLVLLVHADARNTFLAGYPSAGKQALFGLLLGLVVLARLDEAFLLIGIAVWSLLANTAVPPASRIGFLCRAYGLTVGVFAITVAPYFIWNHVEFGHLTPLSGTLKATFPRAVFRWHLLLDYAPWVLLTLLAGLALIPMWRRPTAALPRANVDLLVGLWIGCVLQVCWAVFFTQWGTFQWHFAAHIPTAGLIVSFFLARLRIPGTAWVAGAAVAGGAGVLTFNVVAFHDKGDYHDAAYQAANWARTTTAPATVFALKDAGVFGYFSERRTINLDGLINSYEYQEAIRSGHLIDFLHARHVAFIADAFSKCDYGDTRRVWVRSYLPPRPVEDLAYGLKVDRPMEVYRRENAIFTRALDEPVCFIVWSFDKVRMQIGGAGAHSVTQGGH